MNNLPRAKPAAVMAAVADAYNVPIRDLTVAGRVRRPAPDARKVAARMLHEDCRWSWDRIGEYMNRTADYTRRGALMAHTDTVDAVRSKLYNGNQPSLWG
jgi:hypothetical protein